MDTSEQVFDTKSLIKVSQPRIFIHQSVLQSPYINRQGAKSYGISNQPFESQQKPTLHTQLPTINPTTATNAEVGIFSHTCEQHNSSKFSSTVQSNCGYSSAVKKQHQNDIKNSRFIQSQNQLPNTSYIRTTKYESAYKLSNILQTQRKLNHTSNLNEYQSQKEFDDYQMQINDFSFNKDERVIDRDLNKRGQLLRKHFFKMMEAQGEPLDVLMTSCLSGGVIKSTKEQVHETNFLQEYSKGSESLYEFSNLNTICDVSLEKVPEPDNSNLQDQHRVFHESQGISSHLKDFMSNLTNYDIIHQNLNAKKIINASVSPKVHLLQMQRKYAETVIGQPKNKSNQPIVRFQLRTLSPSHLKLRKKATQMNFGSFNQKKFVSTIEKWTDEQSVYRKYKKASPKDVIFVPIEGAMYHQNLFKQASFQTSDNFGVKYKWNDVM